MIQIHKYARLSVISVVLTSVLTSLHHLFRLGLGSLPMWMPVIMAPIGLMVLFKRSRYKSRLILGAYGLVSYAIILWFGVMDGLFDHTFRVLGLDNVTWLPGGDVEFVETAFQIGSIETSHWIFQITGSFVFFVSLFALYFTTRFLVGRLRFDTRPQPKPASQPQADLS